MRKFIFLAILFIFPLTTSCSKDETVDYSDPENIAGTTWKCITYPDISKEIEYLLLVFTTKTEVEFWSKEIEAAKHKEWTRSFSISNDTISIISGEEYIQAIIFKETISIELILNVLKFKKQ